MTKRLILTPLLFLPLIILLSCGDDSDDPEPQGSTIIVINEGNFQAGDGALSSFDASSSIVNQSIFEANATIQTAISTTTKIYLVTNAPDKVELLNITENTLSSSSTINSGFLNPVSIAVNGDFAYVTNWGNIETAFSENPDSFISIIDLNANQVIDSLEISARPQDIISIEDRLYVANEGSNTISILEPNGENTEIEEEITVPFGPSAFVIDAESDLWVLCTSGRLVEIDRSNNTIKTTLDNLKVNGFDEKIAINQAGDKIYFLGGTNDTFTGLTNVFEVDFTGNNPSATNFITGGFAFYGIAVDPSTGDIYVGDSNAFQSTGTGFQYNGNGELIQQFATGIGPNAFLFL
ncbi:MAG TPA: YncE family protein [Cyclobacteriaceae bacterium]